MRKTAWFILGILVISSMLLTACGGGGSSGGSTPNRQSPPADFANAKNPFEGNQDAVTAGKLVFDTNCSACHGADAKGDGPAGASLNPKPANLQNTAKQTSAQYIHWVVSVGGASAGLNAAMPAFKDVISEEDIWRIATYLTTTYK